MDGYVLAWSSPPGDGPIEPADPVPTHDPVGEVVARSLRPGDAPRRWVAARDHATAIALRDAPAAAGPRMVIRSGDPETDGLLSDLAPVLPVLLADLSDRQRQIARLLLVDGLRQAEIARRLGVSRPTISVAVQRGHLREIAGLASSIRALLARADRPISGPPHGSR